MATLHRIATTADGALLVGAVGSHLYTFDLCSGDVLSSTVARADSDQVHKGGLIRLAVVHETPESKVVITTGEDKLLKVWDLPTLELRSSRELVKRAAALALSPDGKRVVIADKFGDVYDLPLEADDKAVGPMESAAKGKQAAFEAGTLIAGHVSLLTSVLVLSHPSFPHPLLVTADRDEHVRVSAFPKAFVIHRYLLGHRAFVGALAWCPGREGGVLISGGGEGDLRTWDVDTGKELGRTPVDKLAEGSVVDPPGSNKFFHRKSKKATPAVEESTEAGPSAGKDSTAVEDAMDVEAEEGSGPTEATPKRRMCVCKIIVSPATSAGRRTVVVLSAGSSIAASFEGSHLASDPPPVVRYHDFGAPILDASFRSPDRAIFALDASRAATPSEPLRCLRFTGEDIKDVSSELSALASVSRSITSSPPVPGASSSQDDLYPELAYVIKDRRGPADEDGEASPAPKRTRRGQVGGEYVARASHKSRKKRTSA